MAPDILEGLIVIYDVRDAAARQSAHRHRSFWGKLYTDIVALDYDHILLAFRPAPDLRWRPWERVRLQWIREDLEQLQESEAA
jgi:hypothetical protein